MYGDPRIAMGGPSSGVSLSQPGVMISHRPHSMIDMERLGHRPHMGGASTDKSSASKSGSVKSAESLERAALSIEDFDDIDPGAEDRDTHLKVCRGHVTCHVTVSNVTLSSPLCLGA